MQLADIADSLYGLPPEDFTKARDSAVREARASGDADLAGDVKELRRPPVSAWAVNLLARNRSGPLDELLALGAELRDAQAALAGDELRTLSRERHRVIAALTEQARQLVVEAGHKLADPASREVSATLEAALADESAAAAVRSGRLMRPLTSTGLEPVELLGAVAAPEDIAAMTASSGRPRRDAAKAKSTGDSKPKPDDRAARRLDRARVDARDAKAAAERASSELGAAEAAAAAAVRTMADLEARITELTQALRQAKAEHSEAEAEQRRTAKGRDVARSAAETAQRAAQQAEATLARLSDPG